VASLPRARKSGGAARAVSPTPAPGVYDLVVVITLAAKPCAEKPHRLVSDMLGYAEIPVLVFYDEDAPFCPPIAS